MDTQTPAATTLATPAATAAAAACAALTGAHRSIRAYQERPGERERRGPERYLVMGPEMVAAWQELGIETLAQYDTSKIKYDPDLFAAFSADIEALLRERGFLV